MTKQFFSFILCFAFVANVFASDVPVAILVSKQKQELEELSKKDPKELVETILLQNKELKKYRETTSVAAFGGVSLLLGTAAWSIANSARKKGKMNSFCRYSLATAFYVAGSLAHGAFLASGAGVLLLSTNELDKYPSLRALLDSIKESPRYLKELSQGKSIVVLKDEVTGEYRIRVEEIINERNLQIKEKADQEAAELKALEDAKALRRKQEQDEREARERKKKEADQGPLIIGPKNKNSAVPDLDLSDDLVNPGKK